VQLFQLLLLQFQPAVAVASVVVEVAVVVAIAAVVAALVVAAADVAAEPPSTAVAGSLPTWLSPAPSLGLPALRAPDPVTRTS